MVWFDFLENIMHCLFWFSWWCYALPGLISFITLWIIWFDLCDNIMYCLAWFPWLSLPYFKNSDGFSCVVTAHLISSGWISICCHCCFTNQWMWFSICLNCFLSKSREYCFQCVITAHLISIGCISVNVVNAASLNSGYGFLDVSKSIGYGFHVFTA